MQLSLIHHMHLTTVLSRASFCDSIQGHNLIVCHKAPASISFTVRVSFFEYQSRKWCFFFLFYFLQENFEKIR